MADPSRGQFLWFVTNYQVISLLPFIVSAALLYFFLWRQLLRVREFYADARAAAIMHDASAVAQAKALYEGIPTARGAGLRLAWLWPQARKQLGNLLHSGPLAYHPDRDKLLKALDDPILAFGRPWQIGLWTGLAVLLLELMLRGSLTIMYIDQPGPHLPLLTASAVFAIWLLPRLCQGIPVRRLWRDLGEMTAVLFLVKLSINFLDGLLVGGAALLGQLDPLGRAVDLYVITAAGAFGWPGVRLVGGEFSWAQIIQWHIVSPIAYYILFAIPILIATVMIDAWLKRLALTWYSLDSRVRRVFWSITAILLVVQALVVIPIGNRLFFTWIYTSWDLKAIGGMTLGVVLATAGAIAFAVAHRRLSNHCAECSERISGPFEFGQRCPHCDVEQHSWLVANY